jgi:quercetin dioxygenase-like cupin family protein
MTETSITSYENLEFAPVAEGSPVEVAMLWGDPVNGPVAVLVRFPEGYAEPWHSHTSTYRSVLIKGKFQNRKANNGGGTDEIVSPGAYSVQAGGEVHSEANAGEGEMVAFVYFEGPIDFVMPE